MSLFNNIHDLMFHIDKHIKYKSKYYYNKEYLFNLVKKKEKERIYNLNELNKIKTKFNNSINFKLIKNSKIKINGYIPSNFFSIYNNEHYISKEWFIRRNEILIRDKNNCLLCSKKSKLVHHILSVLYYPELFLDPFNLISLCYNCHNKIYNMFKNPLSLIIKKEELLSEIYFTI